ncbi:MAG: NHLP family bacteriocin export ABC transporter peptidase/permease/ATPase subunit [Firmicutes bacterium]|nr:NHLP family bacteriocin export ABC transporter peptidase/permease/ATPase subunit [Bacillota bacterium]
MGKIPVRNYVKVPTVLQMEATECGAASLAMILASYQAFIPLEEMRLACGISRDGSKASNIVKAARRYGMVAKGFRKETEDLLKLKMPVIIHWNFNHFLVLEGFKKGRAYLNDPASGKRNVSYEELDMAFTGVVLTFEKGPDFKPQGQAKKTWRSLFNRLEGSGLALPYVYLVGLFLVIPGLVIPTFSKIFIDDILIGGKETWLRALIWGIVITGLIQLGLSWLQNYYLLKLQTRIAITSAGKFLWHVLRLPVQFFSQRYAGDISARMQSNDRVAQFLSNQVASTFINCTMMVFYFLVMLTYSVKLTLIPLLVVILNIAYLKYVSSQRVDANSKLHQDQGKMIGTAMGGLQIIETLKASGSEGDFFSRIAGYEAKSIAQQQTIGVSTNYLNTVPVLLTALSDALVLILGGFEVMAGVITVGSLIAFRTLMTSFISPVTTLMQIGSQYQEMTADMNRLDDVLNYKPDPIFQESAAAVDSSEGHEKLQGTVEIKDLAFGYSVLEPPLIENFSLYLEPGRRVALVGGSGSGKSTIAKLISGVYEPWSGEILLDGKKLREWPRRVLNNSVAMVDQDIRMFADSVRHNLTLWNTAIPEEDLLKATVDAEIYDVITEKAGGFNYDLKEGGSNFSGGQRQRLEIARALVNRPSILIMDEATSALDPLTEKIIDDNIRRRGCSCIIVAHRLSTIRDCDEIIVLHRGKIVQRGTHEELKDTDGLYADLIKNE